MRIPPLLADFIHARACKPFLRKTLDTTTLLSWGERALRKTLLYRHGKQTASHPLRIAHYPYGTTNGLSVDG